MSSSSSFFSGTNPTPTEYQTAVDLVAQATEKATAALASSNSSAASATSSQNYSIAAGNSATSAANQAASAATSATNAATSATSASNSAATATTQATTATNQATTATTQATNSATSASASSASATAAATSATNAASSATAAATSASNAAATLAGAMVKANNLSDVSNASTARTNLGVAIGSNVQAWDADLDAIAALAGTSGLLKKTAANTWSLDTTSYLSGTVPVANGGTGVTTSTGSGSVVLANSPILVTPALGTPSSGNLANCTFPTLNQNTTGTAANITGTLAVAQGGTGATATTGTGSNVLATSPTLVTPALGTPSSGDLANCTFPTLNQNTTGTASNVTGTVAVANGGTGLNSLTAGYIPFGAGTSAFGNSSTLSWDNSNTRLLIGASSSRTVAGQNGEIQLERAAATRLVFCRNTNDASGPIFFSAKSRGTVTGSYTAVQSGDVLGTFNFAGADGTNDVTSVQLRADVDGAVSTGVVPGRIVFATTGSAGGSPAERMRIDSYGRVGIGATALGGYGVRLSSQITGSVFSYGYYIDSSNAADVTNTYIGFGTYLPTANAVTALRHFSASQNTLTGAVTNQYGFYAANDIIGATNNYGFYSNIASGTGRWNFYANGTAQNYFAGNTGFGIVPSTTSRLRVSNDRASISYAQTWTTYNGATFENDIILGYNGSATYFGNFQANPIIFLTNNAERMRIDSSGNVGIGVVPTSLQLDIGGNTSPTVRCISTTGSVDMRLQSIGASGVGIVGTYSNSPVVFYTNANERMRIRSDGAVAVGGAGAANYSLLVTKDMTGGTGVYGNANQGIIQSDVTSSATYYRTYAQTAAASFTLVNMYGYLAEQGTIGAGSTVTNQYGFHASSGLTGATNNYGFYANIASGTNRWNFYAAGTANNYFAGNVGIGTSSPAYKMTIQNPNTGSTGLNRQLILRTGDETNFYRTSLSYNDGSATSGIFPGFSGGLYYEQGGGFGVGGGLVVGTSASAGPLIFGTAGTERMRIDSSGNVAIGTTPVAGTTLYNGKNITGSTVSIGMASYGAIQSDVTTEARYFASVATTAAATFTVTDIRHYTAFQGTFGAGSTVTNQTGFFVGGNLTGATNNFGFYSNIASGTNRWNFYANGTANNYFAGNVLIGTTTAGASKLTVADDSIQINTAKTPASATATGTTGQVCWDASYIYVCTATNTWKRAAIATW